MANDPEETTSSRRGTRPSAFAKLLAGGCASLLAIASVAALTNTGDGPSGGQQTVDVVSGGAPAATPATAPAPATTDAADASLANQASVDGNKLMRNGVQWTPFGVQLIGFVQSPKIQQYWADNIGKVDGDSQDQYDTKWVWFKRAYGQLVMNGAINKQEYTDIQNWGANTIRLQVSKIAVDPHPIDPSNYDPTFETQVVDTVKYARQIGLNVIVSIQWENQISQGSPTNGVPDDQVRRDWQNLATKLKRADGSSDNGIIFEIMNEPTNHPQSDPNAWQNWAKAMNDTIAVIRATGSTNVVLADGANEATTLNGFIPLADKQVFYAVHAYFTNSNLTQADWDRNFGNAAQSVPVINGEWTTLNSGPYVCNTDTPNLALKLLTYQRDRHIGLAGVSYDTTKHWGNIVQDLNGTATTFIGTDCQDAEGRFGPGRMIQYWYRNARLPGSPN